MRNIKFRAWDKERSGWVDPDNIYINFNGILYFMMVSRPDDPVFSDLIGDCSMEPLAFEYDDPDRLTLMQYTGLKDKHGVEIYEGDIVIKRDRWHDGVEPFTGVVVYDDYCAAFGIRDGTEQSNITSSMDETRDTYEVIGNIYENPELLK